MSESPSVIAVLFSDVHLSHTPPQARSAEPDWYAAMQRPLDEVRALSVTHGDCPIVCAGDVFDRGAPNTANERWRTPPELVNWAIKYLPPCNAVPGQHDLQNHVYESLGKTAYGTLCKAGVITDLFPVGCRTGDDTPLCLWGFPWGCPVQPLAVRAANMYDLDEAYIHLAVVHAYIWAAGKSYPGAPEDKYITAYEPQLQGYHAAVFGDNHMGFRAMAGDCAVINTGGLMRRKSDEIGYKPGVGLLMSDGTIRRHFLDISQDKFTDEAYKANEARTDVVAKAAEVGRVAEIQAFAASLGDSSYESLDFQQAVRRYIEDNNVSPDTASLLLEAIT